MQQFRQQARQQHWHLGRVRAMTQLLQQCQQHLSPRFVVVDKDEKKATTAVATDVTASMPTPPSIPIDASSGQTPAAGKPSVTDVRAEADKTVTGDSADMKGFLQQVMQLAMTDDAATQPPTVPPLPSDEATRHSQLQQLQQRLQQRTQHCEQLQVEVDRLRELARPRPLSALLGGDAGAGDAKVGDAKTSESTIGDLVGGVDDGDSQDETQVTSQIDRMRDDGADTGSEKRQHRQAADQDNNTVFSPSTKDEPLIVALRQADLAVRLQNDARVARERDATIAVLREQCRRAQDTLRNNTQQLVSLRQQYTSLRHKYDQVLQLKQGPASVSQDAQRSEEQRLQLVEQWARQMGTATASRWRAAMHAMVDVHGRVPTKQGTAARGKSLLGRRAAVAVGASPSDVAATMPDEATRRLVTALLGPVPPDTHPHVVQHMLLDRLCTALTQVTSLRKQLLLSERAADTARIAQETAEEEKTAAEKALAEMRKDAAALQAQVRTKTIASTLKEKLRRQQQRLRQMQEEHASQIQQLQTQHIEDKAKWQKQEAHLRELETLVATQRESIDALTQQLAEVRAAAQQVSTEWTDDDHEGDTGDIDTSFLRAPSVLPPVATPGVRLGACLYRTRDYTVFESVHTPSLHVSIGTPVRYDDASFGVVSLLKVMHDTNELLLEVQSLPLLRQVARRTGVSVPPTAVPEESSLREVCLCDDADSVTLLLSRVRQVVSLRSTSPDSSRADSDILLCRYRFNAQSRAFERISRLRSARESSAEQDTYSHVSSGRTSKSTPAANSASSASSHSPLLRPKHREDPGGQGGF
ncbi:MAG: hypothetical protein MHM6MM_001007 [Cercozoa sp. M6MM]